MKDIAQKDQYTDRLIYGVQRLLDAAKRQRESGMWLTVEEVDALLAHVPNLSTSSPSPQ